VDIQTFQARDVIAANFIATTIKVAAVEADAARIKKLNADSIESGSIRSDIVKSGEVSVFVEQGRFQPIFMPADNAFYLINAVSDDGSITFASVAVIQGKVIVNIMSGEGVEIVSVARQVGLLAASKKIKATWIRMS
jgi:hypothetical protein